MRTHSDIVRGAGTAADVAERFNTTVNTVRSWIQRNRIPSDHWATFVSLGQTTFEELAAARKIAA